MDPGILAIILIFLVALLTFALGVFCHFCGEVGSGGRYYGSNQQIALGAAAYTKRAAGDPTSNKCKCSRKFKGQCANCEGDTFVDDGELGSPKDFVGFGGEKEFEFPGSGGRTDSDAIRGLMGNGSMASAPPSALDQPDQGNSFGGGSEF